jgi:hypothetical protein
MSAFADLVDAPRWVIWRNEPRSDDPQQLTKVPYRPDARKASSTTPSSWRTRAVAGAALPKILNGRGGGLGIVLGDLEDGTMLAGIDLDTCRNANGTFEPWAQEILDRFMTYAEISPSGQGAKLFFIVRREDFDAIRSLLGRSKTGRQFKRRSGSDHPPGIEIYFFARFFAVTEDHLAGTPEALATIGQDLLRWLLTEAGPKLVGKAAKGRSDDSRSFAVFRIAHKLRRQRKSFDEFTEAVRTDPETAVWYTEKGIADGARQLHRIWDITGKQQSEVDAIITEFNAKYAVVNEAGLAVVYQQAWDPVRKRRRLDRITFADLRKFYLNRSVTLEIADGKSTTTTAANLWLSHRDRKGFLGGVVFDPKNTVPADCWNLWTGFAVPPNPGDWSLMREHIRRVVCCSDEGHFDYLMNWLAELFQHPNKPGEVAVALRGLKGAGKGIFGRWLHRAWGQHAMHITNPGHLVGNFNAHLRDCVFLFADEAFYAGDHKHESILKALITEEVITVEGKHRNIVEVLNMLHLLLASNAEWIVPASHDERRYFVIDVADNNIGDYDYFAAIAAQMERGGLAAMIHEFLNRDIRRFNVRDIPDSQALTEQKLHSLNSLGRWWLTVLSRGFVWRSRFGAAIFGKWPEFVTTELLFRSYGQWCQENRVNRMQSRIELGLFMSRLYQQARKRSEDIVGEVEALTTDKDIRRGDDWLDREAPIKATMQNGYSLGPLEEARDKAGQHLPQIQSEWQATEID